MKSRIEEGRGQKLFEEFQPVYSSKHSTINALSTSEEHYKQEA